MKNIWMSVFAVLLLLPSACFCQQPPDQKHGDSKTGAEDPGTKELSLQAKTDPPKEGPNNGIVLWGGALAGAVGGVIVGIINAFIACWRGRLDEEIHLRGMAMQAASDAFKSQEWLAKAISPKDGPFRHYDMEHHFVRYMIFAANIKTMAKGADSLERWIISMGPYDRVFAKWERGDYSKEPGPAPET